MHPAERAVRQPAVAGFFYPGDARELEAELARCFAGARRHDDVPSPRAVIAPHAGYRYSGAVAATAYRLLQRRADDSRPVLVIGPSHRVSFDGAALPLADWFRTPLGDVRIDDRLRSRALECEAVQTLDAAHAGEHAVEVQVPFLQKVLGEFRMLPVVLGHDGASAAARIIDRCAAAVSLIVVSSDLSHYLPYDNAQAVDAATAAAIERFDAAALGPERACGSAGIAALLGHARREGWSVFPLDRRNSGDTAGDRARVVGYGAWAFC